LKAILPTHCVLVLRTQAGCKVVSLESHPANALRASAAHSGRMQGSIE